MPFTVSHPAAVLPLARSGLVPSALVIGSTVPDVLYYVPVPRSLETTLSHQTHSTAGVFGLDLALGLLLFVLWHGLVAPLGVAAAPAPLRARLAPELPVPGRRHWAGPKAVLLVVVSLWVGAATHVFWDEFTHPGRLGYRHIRWLATHHGPLFGYAWAQYVSGVVGAALIGLWLWLWWRAAPVADPVSRPQRVPALSPRALVLVGAAVVGAGLAGVVAGAVSGGLIEHSVHAALYRLATWGGGAFLFAVLACALIRAGTTPAAEPEPQPDLAPYSG